MDLCILLALGFVAGCGFQKMKVPAGMLMGSMVVTALLVGGFHLSPAPESTKYIAQAAGGIYIGCSSTKEELCQLRTFYKPVIWLTVALALMNLVLGFLLYFMGYSDLLSSLMCAVPGGITDVTLIAADMGADASRVLLIHLCRLIAGIAIFPLLVNLITPPMPNIQGHDVTFSNQALPPHNPLRFVILCLLCALGAYVGVTLGIPAGCLLGSMVVAFGVRFAGFQVVFPQNVRLGAQVVSGLYIGCLMDPALFHDWRTTLGAMVACVAVLIVNAYVFGRLMQHYIQVPLREGMLMLTPAGASDMALISADIGVHSPRLILMQLYRFIMASALFPQLCYALVQWLNI